MSVHDKKHAPNKVHPTELPTVDPMDKPVSAATGARLLAQLGLTEGEALAMLAVAPATPEELSIATKVDLHSIASALDEATVAALVSDTKVELGTYAAGFEARASNLRVAASAEDKLQHAIDDLHGSARLDAAAAQEALNVAVPQLRSRARVNPAVRKTYSSLLAYQQARYPGRRNGGTTPVPATPVPSDPQKTS